MISTVAGNGTRPPIDVFFCAVLTGANVGDGNQATNAAVFNPAGLAFLPDGSLMIVDQHANRIRRVAPNGVISTIVGGLHSFYAPGIPATSSGLDWPTAVAIGPDGLVYFSELHSGPIARVNADGRFATIAGSGFSGFNMESGPATSVRLWNPTGITFDRQGNLYIADQTNHRVRRVTPDGNLTTIAGTSAGAGFSGDGGPATSAQLNRPTDVKVDRAGNIYISDMSNHRVRRIDPQGIITTFAGDGEPGRGPDGVPAASSSLNMPTGLALDANGRLYIVDWGNFLIRRVSSNGEPAIRSGGAVNAASFAAGPVAPGSLISIVGTALTSGDTLEVRLGDQPATITFRSPEQINAASLRHRSWSLPRSRHEFARCKRCGICQHRPRCHRRLPRPRFPVRRSPSIRMARSTPPPLPKPPVGSLPSSPPALAKSPAAMDSTGLPPPLRPGSAIATPLSSSPDLRLASSASPS